MTKTGKLNGWHVLIILGVFFGIMIAVNVVFTVFAVKTFPGEQVPKSYVQGLHYNDALQDKARQAALGWSTEVGLVAQSADTPRLLTNWYDADGTPIVNLDVSAMITRPASEDGQRQIDLIPDVPGHYRVDLPQLDAGIWRIEVTAVSPEGETATAHKTLTWTP
ncbi:FixH family protein [Ponticaulis profundi]|uniref:FixH family protein n=1 Tax=Ponticaulis profundi TaxID=2665222 RepID=A0ABW1SDP6_9PROT